MGINSHTTLKILNNTMETFFGDLSKVVMIELGNQFIDGNSKNTSKNYYLDKLEHHMSVDINGRSGSIKRDLNQEITDLPKANIVTNFGTSEHVKNQFMCFKNIHNFCKIGGIFFHFVPLVGNWKGHGFYKYDLQFFDQLSSINNYEIIENKIFLEGKYESPNRAMVLCIMKKIEDNFNSSEEFYEKNIH